MLELWFHRVLSHPDGSVFPAVLFPVPNCTMALPPFLLAPDSLVLPGRHFQIVHSFLVDKLSQRSVAIVGVTYASERWLRAKRGLVNGNTVLIPSQQQRAVKLTQIAI